MFFSSMPVWMTIIITLAIGVYFMYKMITDLIPRTFKIYWERYWKRWDKKNVEWIRLANAYRSIYHLDVDYRLYEKGVSDPRWKAVMLKQCCELVRKFKRGQIPESDVKLCQERVDRYRKKDQ